MLLRKTEGFQPAVPAAPTVPATASAAITEFYTNTFLAGARFLPLSELTAEKTINGIDTTFRQIAQKAVFCSATTPVRLTGGDTDQSITSLMNAATRSMTTSLITAYSSTFTTWSSRGLTITQADIRDPSGVDLTSDVLSVRNAYIGTGGHWPTLLTAIQGLVKTTYISNASTAYGLLTGTPVETGKMAQTAKPIVVTLDASGVNLYGSHVGAVGATPVGFFWSTATMGDGIGSGTNVPATLSDNFTAALPAASLTAGTTYYYKAWATNTVGTSYGVERSFVYVVAPTVSALTAANITRAPTSLTIQGTISSVGGGRIIEKGIAWSLGATAPTAAQISALATKAIDLSGVTGTTITQTISGTGLTPGSQYTFVAYAMNDRSGVAIGSGVLAKFPSPPTLFTPTSSSPTTSSITVSCTINSYGTAETIAGVSECGFLWSLTQSLINGITSTIPDISGSSDPGTSYATTTSSVFRVKVATPSSPFSATISHSSIIYNTQIHFKAYVITATEGTAISGSGSATTSNAFAPSVTTTALSSNPTSLTGGVTLSGNISNTGGANITSRGIVVATSYYNVLTKATPGATILEDQNLNSSETGPFSKSFTTTLTAGTQYYYVAYATNAINTTYGGVIQSFRAPSMPTISNNNYTSTSSQITVSAIINSFGGGSYVRAGICYSISAMALPTTSDTVVTLSSQPAQAAIWNANILTPVAGTSYYVRAFVETALGTVYSDMLTTRLFSLTVNGALTATNSGYKLFAFTSTSGTNTFTVTGRNTIQYFVVAGGGGGGNGGSDRTGGGGGGGGVLLSTTTVFSDGTYTVTVGGGGAVNANGSNSSIKSSNPLTDITATGGGYGGYYNYTYGSSGGSGGGAFHGGTSDNSVSTGIAGQGKNGGKGYDGGGNDNNIYAGGGGGGQSAVGDNGSNTNGGTGGAGITISTTNFPGFTTSFSGSTTIPSDYGGGGGGGFQNRTATATTAGCSGSSGGGRGAAVSSSNDSTGTAAGNGATNSGGGGGGCAYANGKSGTLINAGTGGSGIVLIATNAA